MAQLFIEDELLKRSSSGILTPMRAGDVIQSPGLEDLIAGVTPTLIGWDNDPTDAADITDGNPTTFCDTGDCAVNAWQHVYFEWDLGAFYDVLIGGVGASTADAGSVYTGISIWNGSAWVASENISTASMRTYPARICRCSKVRLAIYSSAISTITPNISEFHVWRL